MDGIRSGQRDDTMGASMRASVARILEHQEPNGALVASRDFANYNYCWLRDGSFIAFALDRAGEHDAAARFHRLGCDCASPGSPT